MYRNIIDFAKVKLILAEKEVETHRKGIWAVRNENLDYNIITTNTIPYEEHCNWWESVFDKEHIYLIIYRSDVCGYIRLTKYETSSKEKNEISIAVAKQFQNTGIGSFAYNLFETEVNNKYGITQIIANTNIDNDAGKKFFEKNKFDNTEVIENS